jgi:nitric oxide dioxygenase
MAASAPEAFETSASGASLKQLIPESAAIDIAPKQAAATVLGHRCRGDLAGPMAGADSMTPERVQLVRSSFAKVAAVKDRAAALFYRRLFELDPSLWPMLEGDIAAHGAKFMAALGGVVGSLDRPDEVLPVVRELGGRHAGYGVRPDHYAIVGDALIWTLERGLGAEFTRETRRAWTDAYVHLAWTMVAAADEQPVHAQAA